MQASDARCVHALPDGRFRAFHRGCCGTFETREEALEVLEARRARLAPPPPSRKRKDTEDPAGSGGLDITASWDEFKALSHQFVAKSKELAEIRARLDVVATLLRVDT